MMKILINLYYYFESGSIVTKKRDSWKKFNENLLPNKEIIYSNVNLKNFSNFDQEHEKKFEITLKGKNLGDYHDLHVESDFLLLTDNFEKHTILILLILFSTRITMDDSTKNDKS